MATFSWSVPGSPAVANELRARLNALGAKWGYAASRGVDDRHTAGGVRLLRAVAEGQALVLPLPVDEERRAALLARLWDLEDGDVRQAVTVAEQLKAAGSVTGVVSA